VHTGFQVLYGFPPGSPLRDREVAGALLTHARSKYPDLSPKQAALASMRDYLGIDTPAPEVPENDGPMLVIGSAEAKRTGVQGMSGGQFSRADVQAAVDILEGFQGKAFKSELNKKGNPLGALDPSSIVGIEKDKTIAKQKFVDYLKGVLGAETLAPTPEQPAPEAPETSDENPTIARLRAIEDRDEQKRAVIEALIAGEIPAGSVRVQQSGIISIGRIGTLVNAVPESIRRPLGRKVYGLRDDDGVTVYVADFEILGFEGDPAPDESSQRTPEQLVGQSPETFAELDGLPVGTKISLLGTPYIRNADGRWYAVMDAEYTEGNGLDSSKLAGALRGVEVVSVTTQPRASVSGLREGLELNVGETVMAVHPMGTTTSWTRIPNEEGTGSQLWLDPNGNTQLGDNMPEVLLSYEQAFQTPPQWFVFRDSASVADVEVPDYFPGTEFPRPPAPNSVPRVGATSGWNVGNRPGEDWVRGSAAGSAFFISPGIIDIQGHTFVKRVDGMWISESGRVLSNYFFTEPETRGDMKILRTGSGLEEVPAPEPEVPEVVEPEPLPDPSTFVWSADQTYLGSDIGTMPEGTRLVYTRKDGRSTYYTVSNATGVITTDKGTPVDIEKALRMKFRIESVPGGAPVITPDSGNNIPEPAPSTPDADLGGGIPEVNSRVVGETATGRLEVRNAPIGTVVQFRGRYLFKNASGDWSTGTSTNSASELEMGYRRVEWAHIVNPGGEPWEPVSGSDSWEAAPLPAGAEIPRENLAKWLESFNRGVSVSIVAEGDEDRPVEFTLTDSGWRSDTVKGLTMPLTGLVDLANARRAKVVLNTASEIVAVERTGALSTSEVEAAPDGTVVSLYGDDGYPALLRRDGDVWYGNTPRTAEIRAFAMGALARYGHVRAAPLSSVIEPPTKIENRQQLDSLLLGSVVRASSYDYIKVPGVAADMWKLTKSTDQPSISADQVMRNAGERNDSVFLVMHDSAQQVDLSLGSVVEPYAALDLPNGSRLIGYSALTTTVQHVKIDGLWVSESTGRGASPLQFASSQTSPVRIARLGWDEVETPVAPGTVVTYAEMLRYPAGSKFAVANSMRGERDGEWSVLDTLHVRRSGVPAEGYDAQDFSTLSKFYLQERRNPDTQLLLTYQGVDASMSGTPAVGEKILSTQHLQSLPVGATLRGDTGAYAVKASDSKFFTIRDHTQQRRSLTAAEVMDEFPSLFTREEDIKPLGSKEVTSFSPEVASAAVNSKLVDPTNLDSAWSMSSKGWMNQQGRVYTIAELQVVTANAPLRFMSGDKSAAANKYVTPIEAFAPRPGTKIYLRLPDGRSGQKSKKLRWDGQTWEMLKGSKRLPYGSITKYSQESIVAAALRGDVKVTRTPFDRVTHDEYVEKVMTSTTAEDITELARAQHPGVGWIDWEHSTTARDAGPADQAIATYRDFTIEASRLFDEYPDLRPVESIGGDNSGNGPGSLGASIAFVRHRKNNASVSTSNMRFNMKFGKQELKDVYARSGVSNHFHGVARPGISEGARVTTHEFGHMFDTVTGMRLAPYLKRARDEWLAEKGALLGSPMYEDLISQTSKYSRTEGVDDAELVSETFENWTNTVDVEPLTEHMMMAMQNAFRELTDQPNFTFKKNPGVVGAEPNTDPNYKHSQGSATAVVGGTPTLRELDDLPAGSTLRRSGTGVSELDGVIAKDVRGTWIKPDGFLTTSVSLDKQIREDGHDVKVQSIPGPGVVGERPINVMQLAEAPIGSVLKYEPTGVMSGVGGRNYTKVTDETWKEDLYGLTTKGAFLDNMLKYLTWVSLGPTNN